MCVFSPNANEIELNLEARFDMLYSGVLQNGQRNLEQSELDYSKRVIWFGITQITPDERTG